MDNNIKQDKKYIGGFHLDNESYEIFENYCQFVQKSKTEVLRNWFYENIKKYAVLPRKF